MEELKFNKLVLDLLNIDIYKHNMIFDLEIKQYPYFIEKTENTFNIINKISWLKLEAAYANNNQDTEIHKWAFAKSYLETRFYRCLDENDMLLEDTGNLENIYKNMLFFYTENINNNDIYDKIIIGNNYYNQGFIITNDFFWVSDIGIVDICIFPSANMSDKTDVDEIDDLLQKSNLNEPIEYDVNSVIYNFKEVLDVFI